MKFLESSTFNLNYFNSKINSLHLPNTSIPYLHGYDTLSRNHVKFEVLVIKHRTSYAFST